MHRSLVSAALAAVVVVSCGKRTVEPEAPPPTATADAAVPTAAPTQIVQPVAEPQRPGDPDKGWRVLTETGYIGCGVPRSLYDRFAPSWSQRIQIANRGGDSAGLPYFLNAFTSDSGVPLVTASCLGCHAGFLDGELVIGLGDSRLDFTTDLIGQVGYAGVLITDEKESAEFAKLAGRVKAVAPFATMSTVGANPADAIAAVLFAHRDPKTLAWSDTPLIPIEPGADVPVDTPAWWLLKKKHAMFHTGAGRGDHARIMMTASTLCTDSVEEARAIDAGFAHVRAFIESIEPPRWKRDLDRKLAEKGRAVFEKTCSKCHGTYGESPTYPNKIVALDVVGTDPTHAVAGEAGQFGAPFVRWFNNSFYGKTARLEPQPGYIAPPLDGVFATAPYFHNGSVPTLDGVIDSKKRPRYWRRSLSSRSYDWDRVGWRYVELPHGKAGEPENARHTLYDTDRKGYSNGGHTFGDKLAPAERRALLEYLKTL